MLKEIENPRHIDDLPPHIKPAYRRMALVSDMRHADAIKDDETLIVSCDWLLWQKLIDQNRHAVHYELGIIEWGHNDIMSTDIFVRANDWVYASGKDVTYFRGVSLGRLYGAEINMALLNYHRIRRSLSKLIERFQPEEILFYEFALDVNVLDHEMRKSLIAEIARYAKLKFTACSDIAPDLSSLISGKVYQRRDHRRAIELLLSAYSLLLDATSWLRCLFIKRPRVLIMVNTKILDAIIPAHTGGTVPAFNARSVPKNPRYVWRCLKHGMRLLFLGNGRLRRADRARLDEISHDLETASTVQTNGAIEFARTYFRDAILTKGRLHDMARQVVAADALLNRLRPEKIVIDTARSAPIIIYAELARLKNIEANYIWHSSNIPHNKKMESLGGDPRCPKSIDRCLTWGVANEQWLSNIGADCRVRRVGSPLFARYANKIEMSRPDKGSSARNALLLQYTIQIEDLAGLNAIMYEHMVVSLKILYELGYRNIRYKLHPGPGRQKTEYFKMIARHYGLDCEIHRSTPFHECAEWADIIIGPVVTGALYEALASRKPYYPMMMQPHSLDEQYYVDFPPLKSLEDLREALQKQAPDGRMLLERLYSIDKIRDPAREFWKALGPADNSCQVADN